MSMMLGKPEKLMMGSMVLGGAEAPIIPTQRQHMASFCGSPNLASTLMGSGGSYDTNQIRTGHDVGDADWTQVRIHDNQYALTPGNGAEISSPAATSIWRRAMEIGAITYVAAYAGVATQDLLAGGGIVTDDLPLGAVVVPANSRVFVRGVRKVKNAGTGVFDPATDRINGINQNAPASQGFRTVGGNQIAGNGTLNSSGSGGGNAVWPTRMSGIPSRAVASCRYQHDSIGQYLNDTNTSTTGGVMKRTLQNVGGKVIAWESQGVDANKMQLMTPTLAPLQWVDLNLFTMYIQQCITNDISAGRATAQIIATIKECSQVVKTTIGPYGLPVLYIGWACLNRGTFTGAQNTVKNEVNDWQNAGGEGFVDFCLDQRSTQGDTALYSDNIHPRSVDHAAMAADAEVKLRPFKDPTYRPPGYVSFV